MSGASVSIMNIATVDGAALVAPGLALAAGLVSAVLFGRKRRWVNALLMATGAAALAIALADIRVPFKDAEALAVVTDAGGGIDEPASHAMAGAGAIALSGDGLRDAEWRDLPGRPLQWKPAQADLLSLDFPRTIPLGRIFTLTVRRPQASAGWRLQLLAENKQVLADSGAITPATAPAAQLSIQWLPPVAEAMVLRARLLDTKGKTIAEGPVPLQVIEAVPLQIQGRFDAASFDARALNRLLSDSGAIVDWSVTLGKAIARSETAREPLTAPNAMFADAAYVEKLSPSARAALLAAAGQGVPLVVLGANAADAGFWQRELGLRLQPQSPTTEKEDQRHFNVGGVALDMPPSALNPDDRGGGPWSVLAWDSGKRPWLWQRDLRQGRVIWVGVSEWHRYAISAPQALTLWWQDAMDRMVLAGAQKTQWRLSDPMPVTGLRSEVCAQGAEAGALLRVDGGPELSLQARVDKADGRCAAWWPQRAGWTRFSAAGMPAPGMTYVYAAEDWPLWQRSLRREATARYAARAPAPGVAGKAERPLSPTPFALLFALCMLMLWYRDPRSASEPRGAD
ncbi:hypothetical protein SAMN05428959_108161 [Duganella sp. CF517]|uniref:hypothetical protein n=1 Tax=Duganella sp. CF517 TaxID=1881038 RepID=UPI0008CBC5EC|nr:hypothetical protein [Duganella sp. CF517]SEO46527.1 hypothetical protein SAMN05428959_108161 [Duganella sp. CF517]